MTKVPTLWLDCVYRILGGWPGKHRFQIPCYGSSLQTTVRSFLDSRICQCVATNVKARSPPLKKNKNE